MSIPRALLAAVCLTALILTGCGKSNSNSNAQMRVVNAFSQANALDVSVNAKSVVSGLPFQSSVAIRRRGQRKSDHHRQRHRRVDRAGQYDLQPRLQYQVQLHHLRAADRRRRPAADRFVQRSGRRIFRGASGQCRRRSGRAGPLSHCAGRRPDRHRAGGRQHRLRLGKPVPPGHEGHKFRDSHYAGGHQGRGLRRGCRRRSPNTRARRSSPSAREAASWSTSLFCGKTTPDRARWSTTC